MSEEQIQESQTAYTTMSEKAVKDITVAQMTIPQLKTLIQSTLKETLLEVLGDPDAGLEQRPEFEERLRQAVAHVTSDGPLLSMEKLIGELKGTGDV